jgi:hypothetical protein
MQDGSAAKVYAATGSSLAPEEAAMHNAIRSSVGLLSLLTLACAGPGGPDGAMTESTALAGAGVEESVSGGGQFFHPIFGTVTVAFTAIRHADGSVSGRFQQHQFDVGFSYQGDVTCFAIDPVTRRAWIGGVLTKSDDPDPITEVGDDAWFRVLDVGQGQAEPDRSTFLGFEGGGGIITSEEYCAARIWHEENARTWPLEHGNIVIR